MVSMYPHLIDLNDYPVSWWNGLINTGRGYYEPPVSVCEQL